MCGREIEKKKGRDGARERVRRDRESKAKDINNNEIDKKQQQI